MSSSPFLARSIARAATVTGRPPPLLPLVLLEDKRPREPLETVHVWLRVRVYVCVS